MGFFFSFLLPPRFYLFPSLSFRCLKSDSPLVPRMTAGKSAGWRVCVKRRFRKKILSRFFAIVIRRGSNDFPFLFEIPSRSSPLLSSIGSRGQVQCSFPFFHARPPSPINPFFHFWNGLLSNECVFLCMMWGSFRSTFRRHSFLSGDRFGGEVGCWAKETGWLWKKILWVHAKQFLRENLRPTTCVSRQFPPRFTCSIFGRIFWRCSRWFGG